MLEIHKGRSVIPWDEFLTGSTSATITVSGSGNTINALCGIIYHTDKNKGQLRVRDGTTTKLLITLPDTTGGTEVVGQFTFDPPLCATASAALEVYLTGAAACSLTAIGVIYD